MSSHKARQCSGGTSPAWSWGRSATCPPSRRQGIRSTFAPISSPSARSCTKWRPASNLSGAAPLHRLSQRSSRRSRSRSPQPTPRYRRPYAGSSSAASRRRQRERYASTEDLARDLATVRDRLSEFTSGATVASATKASRLRWRKLAAWTAAALLAALATALLLRRPGAASSERRYFDLVPPGGAFAEMSAVSPDGQRIVFDARNADGIRLLFLREFSEPAARPLPGTESGLDPFWSPDSRTVGFFTALPTQQPRGGKLKRIGISDASPLEICDAPDDRNGSWGADDVILFGSLNGPLYRVSAAGGQPSAVH